MGSYAKVRGGIVEKVIAAEAEFFETYVDDSPGTWIQTSYNTRGGVHYAPNSNTPDGGVALRKNFAGIGFTYDKDRDAFIEPQLYSSWKLNEDTCQWEAPVSYPDDGKSYTWDEDSTSWAVQE